MRQVLDLPRIHIFSMGIPASPERYFRNMLLPQDMQVA